MRRPKLLLLLPAAAVLAAAAWYFLYSTSAADAIRRLGMLRLSLELYKAGVRPPPENFSEVIRAGNLEKVPPLKLAGHPPAFSVKEVNSFSVSDSGSWAYVSNPESPDFGLIFIDCSHRDEKGRIRSGF